MFGVLCIHAASSVMRVWLLGDVCGVPKMAMAPLWQLALHALCCVAAIMIVCSLIDFVRQKWIEAPFFAKCFKS